MLGLGGKKGKAIDVFAGELAADMADRFPAALEPGTGKKAPDKMVRAFQHVTTRAIVFKNENRLGIYGKARLLRALREDLAGRGYSEDFLDSITSALVKSLAGLRE